MKQLLNFYFTIIILMLNGCLVKTTRVIDEQSFEKMISCFSPILQDRGIINCNQKYYSPLFPEVTHKLPNSVGEQLFLFLSPSFQRHDDSYSSFAQYKTNTNTQITIEPFGFIIQQNQLRITVKLLAQLNWYDQGAQDWLIHCCVQSLHKKSFVDYYLVVTPSKLESTLIPELIALYDSISNTCTIVTDFIKTPDKNNEKASQFSFIEVEPGVFSIIKEASKKQPQKQSSSIDEEPLKE